MAVRTGIAPKVLLEEDPANIHAMLQVISDDAKEMEANARKRSR